MTPINPIELEKNPITLEKAIEGLQQTFDAGNFEYMCRNEQAALYRCVYRVFLDVKERLQQLKGGNMNNKCPHGVNVEIPCLECGETNKFYVAAPLTSPEPVTATGMGEVIKTVNDIHRLPKDWISKHAHIIVGPNGKCLCGVYEGVSFTCQQILRIHDYSMVSTQQESNDGSDT